MANQKVNKDMKIMRGTYRPDREEKHFETSSLDQIPDPPIDLTDKERENFYIICKVMIDRGCLNRATLLPIAQASAVLTMWREAKSNINEHGITNVTANGYVQVNGYFSAFEKLTKHLESFYNRFGLDLLSLDRLKISEPEKPDKLDNLLSRG